MSVGSRLWNPTLHESHRSAEGTLLLKRALISIENVVTGNGDDTVQGSDVANDISVNGGFNYVYGDSGNDAIRGGSGIYFPDYRKNEDGTDFSGSIVETLSGGGGDDTIYSNGSLVSFYTRIYDATQWATDALSGDGGNDRLVAGFGNSEMWGGIGRRPV